MTAKSEWALGVVVLAAMVCVLPASAWQADEAPLVTEGRVLGRVLHAEGIALAEARVLLIDRTTAGPPPEAPRREVPTDSGGRFLFSDVVTGSYLLLVEVPDAAIPSYYFDVAPGAHYDTGDVQLAPAVWLNGHVMTEDGEPVGGIAVECLRGPWGWTPGYVATRTDADGRYRCGPVAGGATVNALLDEPTAVRAVATWAAPGAGGETGGPTLVYQPGATVRVSATDQHGNVIPGATLQLLRTSGRPPRPNVQEVRGKQLYRGIPPRDYELIVSADGFYNSEPIRVELVAGAIFDHAVELRAPATATLTIRALVEGQALEGVEINASAGDEGLYDYRTLSTDGDGVVTFEAFPVGPVSITGSYGGLRRLDKKVAVSAAGTALSVTLEPYAPGAVTVRGHLADSQGQPVAGSSIGLTTLPDSPIPWPDYHVETDKGGEFEFRFVVENAYKLCVNEYAPTGSVCFEDLRVSAHTDPEPLTLTLPGSAGLLVRLTSTSGNELPSELRVGRPFRGGGQRAHGTDGEYRFQNLAPEDWSVQARVGDVEYELGSVVLVAGEDRTAELAYAPRLVALTGTVLVDASPLAGASVQVWSLGRGGPNGHTVTDSQGRFALRTLLAGKATLLVYRADRRRMHEQHLALGSDQELVLDIRTQPLRGVVRGRGGRPLGDARVEAHAWDTSASHTNDADIAVAPDGSFETWALAEADWRFFFSAPRYRTRKITHTVSRDQVPEDLVVDLIPVAPLRVAVEPLQGRVPDQVSVWLCPTADPCDSDETSGGVRLDEFGKGVWEEAPEGNWFASIWTGYERRDGLPITIPGEPLQIDRPRPTGSLIVRLPELYGVAVPLTLELFTAEGYQARGYWDGWRIAFTLPGYGELRASLLVAGDYLARVTADDGRVWEQTIIVEAIQRTVVHFRSTDLVADPGGLRTP